MFDITPIARAIIAVSAAEQIYKGSGLGQKIKIPGTGATPKEVTEGCKVTIREGAVYGGLSTHRGNKVPEYVYGNGRQYTVKDIDTHKGVKEALLKEINSWVALSYLTAV